MKVLAVQNAKGGIGKTTTSVHIAAGLNLLGLRVLLIDIDPQASIKSYFKIKLEKGNTLDFITGRRHEECVYKTTMQLGGDTFSFDIMPSSQRMQDLDDKTAGIPRREEIFGLRVEEEDLAEKYDIIIVDCPPTLNLAIKNILTFADYLVIPSEMEGMAITGVSTVVSSVDYMYKYTKKKPEILGILPTKFDGRQKISKSLHEQLPSMFPDLHIFKPIKIDTKVKKAYLQKKTLFECDPTTRASQEYLELVKELYSRMDLGRKENQTNKSNSVEASV